MTSYEITPGAGAEPGLLRSHLRDALHGHGAETAPAQPAETPDGSAGHTGRLAGSSCTALLERANTAAQHTPHPLLP